MKFISIFFIFTTLLFANAQTKTEGYEGFDLSVHNGNVSQTIYNCLEKTSQFAILHGWRSLGAPNPFVIDGIIRVRKSGIQNIGIYVFLKFSMNPREQIKQTVDFIVHRGKQTFNIIWLDIEGRNFWGTCPENIKFFSEAADEIVKQGFKVGIYSSASQWAPILCGYQGFKHLPLWYAHYDGKRDFTTFQEFGGWTRKENPPIIKQYLGDVKSPCGTTIDKNYAPKLPS
jgi:GH25 family lysozyme M1 (1,4-beta-N-acetylmuramidase)